MIDLKFIREHPEQLDAMLKKRHMAAQSAEILQLDADWRSALNKVQELQQQRNQLSKEVGQRKAQGENADDLMAQVKALGPEMGKAEQAAKTHEEALNTALMALPNMLQEEVPVGADENDNVELRGWGEPTELGFEPKAHYDLGEALGQMDFTTAAQMSGSRFVWLQGDLARLERALAAFMLDHLRERGFTEVMPPLLTTTKTMEGTGQLPKFADDQYEMTSGEWLIPTAEVALTNYAQERIIPAAELPLRWCAWTACFRKEAGSAGKDTRGYIRMHQFYKVEMVQLVRPEESETAHTWMVESAEQILRALELPYRVMLLCTGDTGFGSSKTYDLEVWLPAQQAYREISSCSNCLDFQARRMNGRFKEGEAKPQFLHTLNGSGLATGRTLVAVLENYQQADGTLRIPTVLQPYMGGQTVIEPAGATAPQPVAAAA
jgi:seryl-tRNA synthetase